MENQTDVNVETANDVNQTLVAIGKELIHRFNIMQRDACIKVREGRVSELTEEEVIIIEGLDIDKDNPEDPKLVAMFVKAEAPND